MSRWPRRTASQYRQTFFGGHRAVALRDGLHVSKSLGAARTTADTPSFGSHHWPRSWLVEAAVGG
jgi:hypothetical protein